MVKQYLIRKLGAFNKKKLCVLVPCLMGGMALTPGFSSLTDVKSVLSQMAPKQTIQKPVSENTRESEPGWEGIPVGPIIPATPVAAEPDAKTSPKFPSSAPKNNSISKKNSPQSAKKAAKAVINAQPTVGSTSKPKPQSKEAKLTIGSYAQESGADVPDVPIRVALVRDAQKITVATSEPGVLADASGRILQTVAAQSALGVYPAGGGLTIGQVALGQEVWIRAKSDQGLVYVDGKWYRGAVRLIQREGKLLAVNHLDMQPYLYSVVGAEMFNNWPSEALKAQSIAARSYALVHIVRPASQDYDLGNTERWQAYKGVETEANSTIAAATATKGMIISYDGGVVESLYASTNDLVRDAHRGYGMSQYGAKDLAQQNLTFSQILGRFYPGTQLALLQAN